MAYLVVGVVLGGLAVVFAVVAVLRRRSAYEDRARELHRLFLLRLLDHVRYMPDVPARDVWAAHGWLRSARRFKRPPLYDDRVRLHRLIHLIADDQRRLVLREVLGADCAPELVDDIEGWLQSNPLDPRIGAALAESDCELTHS